MWHLDTNIVIALLNGSESVARDIAERLPDVAMSSLVLGELLYGARASARADENLERIGQLLQLLAVVDFDRSAADVYSCVRLSLRRKGRPIGEMDTLLAATALAQDAVFVTHNTKHFAQVEELKLEDWLV